MHTITWLVLCSEAHAYIYDITQRKQEIWEEPIEAPLIKAFEFPEGEMKGAELVTDRAGHFSTQHTTRGKYVPHETPHENAVVHFAITLTHFLDAELAKKHFHQFVLCAEPHFYGLLKQHFSKQLALVMTRVIRKDYVPLDAPRLKHLINDLRQEVAKESFDL